MFISISSSSHCQKVVIYIKSGDQHLLHFSAYRVIIVSRVGRRGKKREEKEKEKWSKLTYFLHVFNRLI